MLIHMIHIPQMIHPTTVEAEMIQIAIHTLNTAHPAEEVVMIQSATQSTKIALQTTVEVVKTPVEVVQTATQNTKSAHQMVEVVQTPVEEDPAPVDIPQLTGLLEVKFPQSKTKVSAVAAGLSLPLETSLPEELSTTIRNQLITPSNNSSIAPLLLETMDAKVVSWILLSNTLKPLHSRPQLTTHTKL